MQVIIIGAKGQLGADLVNRAASLHFHPVGVDLPECDITSPESLFQLFEQTGPVAAVVNAAAYTAVDRAEKEADFAYAANKDGPEQLAKRCHEKKIPLIHISTDYVFDGSQTRPYRPSDPLRPMGVYGQSKAAGEETVRENCPQHVIVRTSWLYGLLGHNFVKTMLRLGNERDVLQVVDDQVGSPTYAGDLADALLTVAAHVTKNHSDWGTYHYCNSGACTWYAFARKIFILARRYQDFKVQEVRAILTKNYPTPAPRPQYSVLDCTSLEDAFAIKRRSWEKALKEMLEELYSTRS